MPVAHQCHVAFQVCSGLHVLCLEIIARCNSGTAIRSGDARAKLATLHSYGNHKVFLWRQWLVTSSAFGYY